MSKHRAGGKFTPSHTSIIEHAIPVIDCASKLPAVSKIVLGPIVVARSKQPRIKFTLEATGLKVVIYSSLGFQTFHILTTDQENVQYTLQKAFDGT